MRVLVIAATLLICGCGAGRGWDRANTAMEVTFLGELAVDAVQTSTIVADCQEYNPIVGPCNNRMPYQLYVPVLGVLHVAAALVLPPRYRDWFQAATIGVEGHVVFFNALVPDQQRPVDSAR
jgi:hypothetical protein